MLRDRVRTGPSALPETILMSARAPRGSRASRAPKTSRNVRPPHPAYTDDASTRTDHMRKSYNYYCSAKKKLFYSLYIFVLSRYFSKVSLGNISI